MSERVVDDVARTRWNGLEREKMPVAASRGMIVTATVTGAVCWRAGGMPAGPGRGLARRSTRFFTDPRGIAARAAAAKA